MIEDKKADFSKAVFSRLVTKITDLPKDSKPQVVFAGKSNVGKSSVLNKLCRQNKLARTSQAAGKTRNLVFFDVSEEFYLVDLPGYGFSKSSKAEQARFSKLTDDYLHSESPIALILHLLDIRHMPTRQDLEMVYWLEAAKAPYTILLNKADKLSRPKQEQMQSKIKKFLQSETGIVFPMQKISAETGLGIASLADLIRETIACFK